jgi:Cu2+-containing amine oxidase
MGLGVKKDVNEAAKWIRKAAEQGFDEAQVVMSKFYLVGEGVEKDVNEAAKWDHKAAEQGHRYALLRLYHFYKNGIYNANVDLGDNYLIYIKKGEDFKPEQYLESLIAGNNIYSLKNQNPPVENLSKDEIEDLGSDRDLEVRTYINNYVDPEKNIDPFVAIVNVDIDNEVRKYVPGIYSVTYTVNYENRYIGYARLNVVVEE